MDAPSFTLGATPGVGLEFPTGQYYLLNDDGANDPVGNEGPPQFVKPVVRVKDRTVWRVQHVAGDQYILSVDTRFHTFPQGEFVSSNSNPDIKGYKWLVTTKEDRKNRYTIVDPESHKGWTLKPREHRVSLEHVPYKDIKPPQLWLFRTIFHPGEEESEDVDEDEDEEV